MPCRIGPHVKNEIKVEDPVSGSVLTFYYRIPNSEERRAYMSAIWEREKDTIRSRLTEARFEFGLKILEGFGVGDFEKEVAQGQFSSISSDPKDPLFDPGWKDLIAKERPDLIEALAAHIFEGVRVRGAQTEIFDEKN